MRLLKISLYLLALLVLQVVVFARLNFFGAAPDPLLVAVIILSIREDERGALLFAAAAGLLQDVLSAGIYLNALIKIPAAAIVSLVRQSFLGDEYSLVAGLVAIFTPLVAIVSAVLLFFTAGRAIAAPRFVAELALATIYNLILVPLLLPLTGKLLHD